MTDRFYASYDDTYAAQRSAAQAQGYNGRGSGQDRPFYDSYSASRQVDAKGDLGRAEHASPDLNPFEPGSYSRDDDYGATDHSAPVFRPRIAPRSDYAHPAPMGADPAASMSRSFAQRRFGDHDGQTAPYRGDSGQLGQDVSSRAAKMDNPGLYRPQDRMAKAMHWAGAACSAVFLIGAVFWAYELAVRDVRGIPVVRAAEGPLRIAPEVPGGKISANQGLAVNAIAAHGGTEDLPNEVVLAPAPLALAQEDISLAAPTALTALAASLPEDMPISDEAAVEAALAMALAEGGDIPQAEPQVFAQLSAEPVTKSLTDASQPAEMMDQDVVLAASPTPSLGEIDPALIPLGTKMVQLGAFDDAEAARSEWTNLQTRFADLMGAKALVVQQAKSGGRAFFRLRAHGFANEDETRRFCAALLAENASCIPVAQR